MADHECEVTERLLNIYLMQHYCITHYLNNKTRVDYEDNSGRINAHLPQHVEMHQYHMNTEDPEREAI
jgi:hypothetical protein